MISMIKPVAASLFCVAVVAAPAFAADPQGLDALLSQVRQGQAENTQLNREREQRFLSDKSRQSAMVSEAEAALRQARSRADAVRRDYDAEQKAIADLKAQLQTRAGDYVQVNAAVRQLAGDFRAVAADSFVTAQFPERMAFVDQMARSSELPSVAELESLWFELQRQMTESGKVAAFTSGYIDEAGVRREGEVVRVGEFTAVADGRYLIPDGGVSPLVAVPRQPGGRATRLADDFGEPADADEAVRPIVVDPTRGTLLVIEGEKPGLGERIAQGGLVGYVIIGIGIAGLLIAVGQLLYLERVGARMRAQLRRLRTPSDDNPLGRVLNVFRDDQAPDEDPELLELRLSEAVLKEMPALERAQSILKLFAAAAPLLGLLGTVTGMIVTFQTITVFGTGDPKLMADGISQALVTTVLGLVAAIPLLFVNALLATRARGLVQILDEQSAGLLAERLEATRA